MIGAGVAASVAGFIRIGTSDYSPTSRLGSRRVGRVRAAGTGIGIDHPRLTGSRTNSTAALRGRSAVAVVSPGGQSRRGVTRVARGEGCRVVGLALGYYLVMSTFALAIGLYVGNLVKPGEGLEITPGEVPAGARRRSAASRCSSEWSSRCCR